MSHFCCVALADRDTKLGYTMCIEWNLASNNTLGEWDRRRETFNIDNLITLSLNPEIFFSKVISAPPTKEISSFQNDDSE